MHIFIISSSHFRCQLDFFAWVFSPFRPLRFGSCSLQSLTDQYSRLEFLPFFEP
jgi:hypothetical protein